ncbi:hypothetical protein BDN71DRAFT_1351567, partial [Pleurotus eryngii]
EAPRVETSADFAKRMASRRFVLHGPGQRKEGGSTERNSKNSGNLLPVQNDAQDTRGNPVKLPARSPIHNDGPTGTNTPPQREPASNGSTRQQEALPPTLLDVVSSSNEGIDVPSEIKDKYGEDVVFKNIVARPNEFRNYEVDKGLLYLRRDGKRVLCVPLVYVKGRNVREIIIAEAHSLLAHLGALKTLDYL